MHHRTSMTHRISRLAGGLVAFAAGDALIAIGAMLALLPVLAEEPAPWSAIISPDNSFSFMFVKADQTVYNLDVIGWGPNWQWIGVQSRERATGPELTVTQPFVVNRDRGETIQITCHASRTSPRSVAYRYDLSADKDVPLAELVAAFSTQEAFRDGSGELTGADGTHSTLPLSFALIASRPATAKAVLKSAKAGEVTLTMDPPCELHIDHGMRVILASQLFKQGALSDHHCHHPGPDHPPRHPG